jgi:hypothetical protein
MARTSAMTEKKQQTKLLRYESNLGKTSSIKSGSTFFNDNKPQSVETVDLGQNNFSKHKRQVSMPITNEKTLLIASNNSEFRVNGQIHKKKNIIDYVFEPAV